MVTPINRLGNLELRLDQEHDTEVAAVAGVSKHGSSSVGLAAHPLLSLLQLASPALPVGAYSYSEGLETLVATGVIQDAAGLQHWITQELSYGVIRIEVAVLVRAYRVAQTDPSQLKYWNAWLSALRETTELRQQNWQMGRSLLRLLQDLEVVGGEITELFGEAACNFAIAYALAAAHWRVDLEAAVLGYLQSWATNLISAGIKLIPLGQTSGQRLLLSLQPVLLGAIAEIMTLKDEDLVGCSWGLTLASMNHETQYSRLFRS